MSHHVASRPPASAPPLPGPIWPLLPTSAPLPGALPQTRSQRPVRPRARDGGASVHSRHCGAAPPEGCPRPAVHAPPPAGRRAACRRAGARRGRGAHARRAPLPASARRAAGAGGARACRRPAGPRPAEPMQDAGALVRRARGVGLRWEDVRHRTIYIPGTTA